MEVNMNGFYDREKYVWYLRLHCYEQIRPGKQKDTQRRTVVLSYGDGSTLKLWDLPDPQEENRHNLFIHYTDNEGNVFSYINYRMTLETMMIRYLKYGNNEVLG